MAKKEYKYTTLKEALIAVNEDGYNIEDCSPELQKNEDVVFAAVGNYGSVLKIVNDNFKNNKEIVMEAIKQNPLAIAYASDELKKDDELIKLVLKADGRNLQLFDENIRGNYDYASYACNSNPWAIQYVTDELKDSTTLIKHVITRNPALIKFASKRIQNSPGLCVKLPIIVLDGDVK